MVHDSIHVKWLHRQMQRQKAEVWLPGLRGAAGGWGVMADWYRGVMKYS